MIPLTLQPVANHLWQSTLFAIAIVPLAFLLKKNRAETRHWLWLAASIKFLIPFSLLMSAGSQLGFHPVVVITPRIPVVAEQISQPFSIASDFTSSTPSRTDMTSTLIPIAWLCGFVGILAAWFIRWRRIQKAVQCASSLEIAAPIPVRSSPHPLEPGVFGIFKPVLLLPEGIAKRLTPAQLDAILAHELCHVRRRDNLSAAVHMCVEAIFWFHPLVWWIGSRLVEERERACDEEVLRLGNAAQTYAEGILNVCKFYVESPLACASGVTGSDLKKRIEEIMTGRISLQLTLTRKLLLATAGTVAVAAPIFLGVVHAQTKTETQKFEVASIKPSDPNERSVRMQMVPGGGLNVTNMSARRLIEFAYDVQGFQIIGTSGWVDTLGYDILAKPPLTTEAPPATPTLTDRESIDRIVRLRAQALLQERFHLTMHRDTKELPAYILVVAKNGHKLKPSTAEPGQTRVQFGRGEINVQAAAPGILARGLARRIGRPVIDQTGLTGTYDYKVQWDETGEPGREADIASTPNSTGPSLFTALQEQLGLKLESQKTSVEIIVVDKIDKPTEN